MDAVIYEDDEVLILHKKSGIPVQTKRAGEKDMVSLLRNYRAEKGEEPFIGLVHGFCEKQAGFVLLKQAGFTGKDGKALSCHSVFAAGGKGENR